MQESKLPAIPYEVQQQAANHAAICCKKKGTYLRAASASRHQLRAVFRPSKPHHRPLQPKVLYSHRIYNQPAKVPFSRHEEPWSSIMINAFLVFNGQGQPRLTKFYTQLVCHPLPLCCPKLMMRLGRKRAYNSASYPKSLLSSRTDQPDLATSYHYHLCLPLPAPPILPRRSRTMSLH
jgi:hypothetical protein